MTKLLNLLVVLALLAATAAAQTHSTSVADHGAVSGDGQDDSAAFQSSLDSLPGGGGTVFIPAGRFNVDQRVFSTGLAGKHVRWLGDGGASVVAVNTPGTQTFYLANAETVVFERLAFTSRDPASDSDAEQVVRVDGAKLFLVADCSFNGIAVAGSVNAAVVWGFSSNTIVERSHFYGSASQGGQLILISNFRAARLLSIAFHDYGNLGSEFHSKSRIFTNAWATIRDPVQYPQSAATNGGGVYVDDIVGDEGARSTLVINPSAGGRNFRIHSAVIRNVRSNLANAASGSRGIFVEGVDDLTLEGNMAGWTPTDAPAFVLDGNRYVLVRGQHLAAGVNSYEVRPNNGRVELVNSTLPAVPCPPGVCWAGAGFGSLQPWPAPSPTPPPDSQGRFNHAHSAAGGRATVSSQFRSNLPAEAAINGDRRSPFMPDGRHNFWHSGAGSAKPDWIEVRFAAPRAITEVVVVTLQDAYNDPAEPTEEMTFRLYGVTAYEVQYWDGSAWVTLPGAGVTGNDRVLRRFNFPAVTTDRIRVLVRAAADGWSRIMEVEAWGG